jgi:hypothetical protein
MKMKRFTILFFFVVLILSCAAQAQRTELGFSAGASSVGGIKLGFACPACAAFGTETVDTGHQVFLEGTAGLRLVNARVASIHLELPIVGVPHQNVRFSLPPSDFIASLSSLYITPSIKAKFLPASRISPWVSAGGGWAHFSMPNDFTNKGALQFGGGADIKTSVPHFGFRLEIRDFLSGQPSFGTPGVGLLGNPPSGFNRHNVLAGGGILVHF